MKILFDHPSPFFLAHGGFQTQIEQTKRALESLGVEVEWLRWWDDTQRGDIIHYFGRPAGGYIDLAHRKGMKVVVGELHTGLGSRSDAARFAQKMLMTVAQRLLPKGLTARLAWDAYKLADAFIALTPWEAYLMRTMFDAPPDRVHVIPNGVEEVFFQAEKRTEKDLSKWLVCTATITERKRTKELAEAAIVAGTPLWIIGNPYSKSDQYYIDFLKVVASSNGIVRYEGGISDRQEMAEIYRTAKGFVLLSAMESLSLSALEAAACGSPLLLSELPWAQSYFRNHAEYCNLSLPTEKMAGRLKEFSNTVPLLAKIKPMMWQEVGTLLMTAYSNLEPGLTISSRLPRLS